MVHPVNRGAAGAEHVLEAAVEVLRHPIRYSSRYSKAAHPYLRQSIRAVYCGGDRYRLRPARSPIHDSKQVRITLRRRQRAN